MCHQLLDRDIALAHLGKFGDVSRHRIAQTNLPAFDQNHDRGRRGHDLCQRGEIEDRVNRHRLGLRFQRAIAVGAPPDDFALPACEHYRARQLLARDLRFHSVANVRQLCWRHPDR